MSSQQSFPLARLACNVRSPGYNLTILGDVILKRTNRMEIGQLCTNSMMGMTLDLNMAELPGNKEGGNDERVKEWQKTQEPAAGDRSMQPVLVVQGLNGY
ncbi:hypothetical protein NW765_017546 [Fusarium oxysporum]|nr:hypothetical protein NW765_017546 [Fusarium oxysporum]